MPTAKIDLNHNTIRRTETLDELAKVLFPGNRNHQRLFLAIFVELKWAEDQFLPVLDPIADEYGFSRRVLETVRAKMRRLGVIDHVSRFNKAYGYREGWVFSRRFAHSLKQLAQLLEKHEQQGGQVQQQRDRDSLRYV